VRKRGLTTGPPRRRPSSAMRSSPPGSASSSMTRTCAQTAISIPRTILAQCEIDTASPPAHGNRRILLHGFGPEPFLMLRGESVLATRNPDLFIGDLPLRLLFVRITK